MSRSFFSSSNAERPSPYSLRSRPNSSLFTPGKKRRTRVQVQNRCIAETSCHTIEDYGPGIPVAVQELLTQPQGLHGSSCQLGEDGWARLVYGGRVLIWCYKPGPEVRLDAGYELRLPITELRIRCENVAVWTPGSTDVPSCLVASPDGLLRYWPSCKREASFREIDSKLDGEMVSQLIPISSTIVLMITSTSVIYVIDTDRDQLAVRRVRSSSGLLRGIGRRMSSMLFGAGSTQSQSMPLVKAVCVDGSDNCCSLALLTDSQLQLWSIRSSKLDTMDYQIDVKTKLFEEYKSVQEVDDIWLLDMQIWRSGVLVLCAATSQAAPNEPLFAAVALDLPLDGTVPDDAFRLFFLIDSFIQPDAAIPPSAELLVPDPSAGRVFVCKDNLALSVNVTMVGESSDKVEFRAPGESVIGIGVCERRAVFFSSVHGILAVRLTGQAFTDTSISEHMSESRSFVEQTGMEQSTLNNSALLETSLQVTAAHLEELQQRSDAKSQLKASFLYFNKGNALQSEHLLKSLLESSAASINELVIDFSCDIIDDVFSSDPRWAEQANRDGVSSSTSLLLQQQLQDKSRAITLFIRFLQQSDLLNKLGLVCQSGRSVSTRLVLCECAEKVAAAFSLARSKRRQWAVIDEAIHMVLKRRRDSGPSNLSPRDKFFRKVSSVEDVITALVEIEEKSRVESHGAEHSSLISSVNELLIALLESSWKIHEDYREFLEGADRSQHWIVTFLRKSLLKQLNMTAVAASEIGTSSGGIGDALELRDTLYLQLLDLSAILLQTLQLADPVGFVKHRRELVQLFWDEQRYEQSASLAERFEELPVLVRLCDMTSDEARLQKYLTRFSDQGMLEAILQWYMDQGKPGYLLKMNFLPYDEVVDFLQQKPELCWAHQALNEQYSDCKRTLMDAAEAETACVSKKKTLLSLAKLAALCEDADEEDEHDIEVIDGQQDVIIHQELLPQKIIEYLGDELQDMRVLSPKEMIELYVGDRNEDSNEFDFRKALDLLRHMDKSNPDEINSTLLYIWSRAALKDDWSSMDTDDPVESSKSTIFFRTLDLLAGEGELAPRLEDFFSCKDLGELTNNKTFEYLVRAGCEHMARHGFL